MTSRIELPVCTHEPLAGLLNTLSLERAGKNRYRAENIPQLTGRVYGGQILAQATMAAADTVNLGTDPDERLAHSITAAFLRPGKVDVPTEFEVVELNDARSFSTRSVRARQNGVILFTARVSFQLHQPGPSFGTPVPEAPDPDTLDSSVDFFSQVDNDWASHVHDERGGHEARGRTHLHRPRQSCEQPHPDLVSHPLPHAGELLETSAASDAWLRCRPVHVGARHASDGHLLDQSPCVCGHARPFDLVAS